MNFLITGGMGFIGSYVTKLLINQGETVVTYDVNLNRDVFDEVLNKEEINKVISFRGDITDLANIIRISQQHKVKKIIHMASLLTLESAANPALAVKVNCEGTTNIFETARILSLEKVVWASSVSVFGPQNKYKQEYVSNDAPHYPSNVYGACKSLNESLAEYYFNEYGIDSVALRFPPVYGIGHRGGASANLTKELLINPVLGQLGKVPYGDDILNWLFVEDAATAVLAAVNSPTTKTRAFNIGGEVRSTIEAVKYVKLLIPGAEMTMLPGYTMFPAKVDTTAIKEELEFQPKWSLEKGIREVIKRVQNNKERFVNSTLK